jgi:DNA invertase Pin-like site-specific DNA recombinase
MATDSILTVGCEMIAAASQGGKRVGYVRISSLDQNELRQLDGIELNKTFMDKASGKDTSRPQLQACLEYLRDGDVLLVHSMDRLARNLDDLRRIVKDLTHRGVQVQFMKEQLVFNDEDSAMSRLLLSVMGAFAELKGRCLGNGSAKALPSLRRRAFTRGENHL